MALITRKFILTLSRHPVLGWLLAPYWAIIRSKDIIDIEELADSSNLQKASFIEVKQAIVTHAAQYSEKNLMTIYSKEKNMADFSRKIQGKQFKENIRPYIETKHLEIIELARLNGIDLYQRDAGQKRLFSNNRIHIPDTYTQATFNFQLTKSTFRYAITCLYHNKQVELEGKTPIILSATPACIVFDRTLFIFEEMKNSLLIPFLTRSYVEVPASETLKYMEKIILPAIEHHPTEVSGFNMIEEPVFPVAELSIVKILDEQPALSLHFRYNNTVFSPGKITQIKYARLLPKVKPIEIRMFSRNQAWEEHCVDLLLSLFKRVSDTLFVLPENNRMDTLLDWIIANRLLLTKHFKILQPNTSTIYFIGDLSIKREVLSAPDWFDIKIQVQIGDFHFPFICFRQHIMAGIREFVLPDDTIALLPVEWFTDYREFFSFGKEEGENIRLKKAHHKLLETWMDESDNNENSLEKLTQSYANSTQVMVPPHIKATLRGYQKEGFSWMAHLFENGFGGCLADDMGLGKTLQTITLLQHLYAPVRSSKTSRPATLIVLPTSLVHNWKREIRKFSRLTMYEYSKNKRVKTNDMASVFRDYNLILATYGIVRNDIEYLRQYHFECIILDESQYIKNPDSLTYKTLMQLNSGSRLTLTGTPIENSLKDLWAQFNFINPGLLGSANEFRTNFIIPITKDKDERMASRLQQMIQPFFLRRTKEEVAPELPPLTEEVLYCDMSVEQAKAYIEQKNMIRNKLLAGEKAPIWSKNTFMALQGITRLRLMANHPQMVLPNYEGISGKMEQILLYYEMLMEEKHKVLIFSSFVKHLRLLANAFSKRGWKYAMLTGETPDREGEIRRFSTSKAISCFFISLKAGGVGLNLTEADYVFIIDPWWNPAAEMQAVSRAHRIGQDKPVMVYRFISSNTIEEKIIRLQETKSKLAETYITSNNPLQGLSGDDLADLLL